ncbi:hypothetical protein Bint_2302 [Brachyspira intermedia PWS/A]|uniref:DUF4352 domain-containing protein n=1 Tax=Brachyspira intermedia (strain ATCC 51140 / PWS/A) TaxID=1045858 RepID=G0EMD7_BRAIP|nr:hypothetical protein [Brachyspira intermedia]AEM22908.1 hypothetical protein Bint_2302 [Brachyspira intermedia PWS/A]
MIKKLFLFTLLVSSFLVISCSNEDTTGSTGTETRVGTGIDLKYAGEIYEALNVQKKNGTVLSVLRITISNDGGYKLFYVETSDANTYNGEVVPKEIFKVSDTKYNTEFFGEVTRTFEFASDGSTLTLHEPNSYNEDIVLTKK